MNLNKFFSNISNNQKNIALLIVFFIISIPVNYYISAPNHRAHSSYVIMTGCFFLVVLTLIWVNLHNLSDFHIDRISLITIFIFAGIFRRRVIDSVPTFMAEVGIFLILVFFIVIFYREKPSLVRFNVFNKWNFIGIVWVILFVILAKTIERSWNFSVIQNNSVLLIISYLIRSFVYQMGITGIIEEPIFRGFLWGVLKKYHWKEIYILFFQTLLFMLSHLFYWDQPINLFVVVPLLGLLYGVLTWKSKSIFPAMIAHSLYNTLITFLHL